MRDTHGKVGRGWGRKSVGDSSHSSWIIAFIVEYLVILLANVIF
jgi:hypothetical protein